MVKTRSQTKSQTATLKPGRVNPNTPRGKPKKAKVEIQRDPIKASEDMFPDLEQVQPLPPVPEVVELMDIDDKALFGVFESQETDVFGLWVNEF